MDCFLCLFLVVNGLQSYHFLLGISLNMIFGERLRVFISLTDSG